MAVTVVAVTAHAIERARARRHFADLAWREVSRLIELEVALAVNAGRVATSKPSWTRLLSRGEMHNGLSAKTVPLEAGQQFVWNEAETLGWVVKRDGRDTVVVTSLHRVRSVEVCAA